MADAVLPRDGPLRRGPGRAVMGLLSGVLLFVATQFITGYLAAIAIPGDFFAFFGRERTGLALFIVHFTVLAIPLCLVALIWSWLTFHWSGEQIARTAALCLAGWLTGLAVPNTVTVLDFVALDADGKVPLEMFVRNLLWPFWWVLPILLAVPTGIGVAAWLYAHRRGSRQAIAV